MKTLQRKHKAKCKECGELLVCSNCGKSHEDSTEFSDWLRNQRYPLITSLVISCQNLDYIWHNFQSGWFMLIEEKRFCGKASKAQKDTHNVVDQVFKFANEQKLMVDTLRGKKRFEYRGFFLVAFSGSGPESSESITINDVPCDLMDLRIFLAHGKLPVKQ